jgi:hypothetical protein
MLSAIAKLKTVKQIDRQINEWDRKGEIISTRYAVLVTEWETLDVRLPKDFDETKLPKAGDIAVFPLKLYNKYWYSENKKKAYSILDYSLDVNTPISIPTTK